MSITGITSSQSSAVSLITGTQSTSSTSSVSDVMAQGQGIDEATISKGAQQMSTLQKLQTSDPEKFKEAAQKISDALAEKAKNSTDSTEASALSDMSSKWAEAATSGNMDSLKPSGPPPSNGNSQDMQNAIAKFKAGGGSSDGGPMGTMMSVVGSVLSDMGVGVSSSSTSSVSSSTATAA